MSPIEVEAGPMFSGKSSELKRLIKRREIQGKVQGVDYLVYNFSQDTRYGENILATHNGDSIPATPISSSSELLADMFDISEDGQPTLKDGREPLVSIFIDEAQFFDKDLGVVLSYIDNYYLHTRGHGINIFCAGLDMDFKGEPFGPMPDLMARAVKVNKFTAICSSCNEDAQHTQRLVDGEPARYDDPIFLVGAKDHYTSRCQKHHEVPGKPIPSQ